MKKGDIVLVPFPFTDLSGQKNRPAVVLVVADLDVTVVFMTTQLKWNDALDIMLEPSPTNGLKTTSLVKLNKIATLDKEMMLGKLGSLSQQETMLLNKNLIELLQL